MGFFVLFCFFSAVKLEVLTWGSMGVDLLVEPASSGHQKNCSFWQFHVAVQVVTCSKNSCTHSPEQLQSVRSVVQ